VRNCERKYKKGERSKPIFQSAKSKLLAMGVYQILPKQGKLLKRETILGGFKYCFNHRGETTEVTGEDRTDRQGRDEEKGHQERLMRHDKASRVYPLRERLGKRANHPQQASSVSKGGEPVQKNKKR